MISASSVGYIMCSACDVRSRLKGMETYQYIYFQRKDLLEMEFPIDIIESIPGAMKIVTQSVDIAKWIANQYRQHRDSHQSSETQDNERMDDCFLKTLSVLRQESDSKKLEHIKHFAQNTILSETCDLDTEGILRFLMDIEQMTWRQICFIEGFNRREREEIEIKGIQISDVNGELRFSEIKKLVSLDYLLRLQDGYHLVDESNRVLNASEISIREMGTELATRMDLESIRIDEIGRAFGSGMIEETKTY